MYISASSILQRISILIIDDDAIMRRILTDALTRLGFTRIFQAKNGQEGIDILWQEDIDIVLCDWVMRPMDGIEFTQYIRTNAHSPDRFVPIILTTGRAELKDVERARDVGVTEYLAKPFDVRTLCDRIISVVERPRSFVVSKHFKGPDRRRRGDPGPHEERRKGLFQTMPEPSSLPGRGKNHDPKDT